MKTKTKNNFSRLYFLIILLILLSLIGVIFLSRGEIRGLAVLPSILIIRFIFKND